jgi:hypothetical protein
MSKLDFDSVSLTTPTETDYRPEGAIDDDDIPEMIELVLSNCRDGSFKDMIADFHESFESRGWLTARQYEVLERAYFKELREEG